jgi:hypothetical protein
LTVLNRRLTAHSASEAITSDGIDLTAADANIGQLPIGEMFQLSAGARAGVPLGYGGSDTRKGLKKTTAHGDNPCVQGSKFDPEYVRSGEWYLCNAALSFWHRFPTADGRER